MFDFGNANQITIFAPLNFLFHDDEKEKNSSRSIFCLENIFISRKVEMLLGIRRLFFVYNSIWSTLYGLYYMILFIWVEVLISHKFSMDGKCSKTNLGDRDFGDIVMLVTIHGCW